MRTVGRNGIRRIFVGPGGDDPIRQYLELGMLIVPVIGLLAALVIVWPSSPDNDVTAISADTTVAPSETAVAPQRTTEPAAPPTAQSADGGLTTSSAVTTTSVAADTGNSSAETTAGDTAADDPTSDDTTTSTVAPAGTSSETTLDAGDTAGTSGAAATTIAPITTTTTAPPLPEAVVTADPELFRPTTTTTRPATTQPPATTSPTTGTATQAPTTAPRTTVTQETTRPTTATTRRTTTTERSTTTSAPITAATTATTQPTTTTMEPTTTTTEAEITTTTEATTTTTEPTTTTTANANNCSSSGEFERIFRDDFSGSSLGGSWSAFNSTGNNGFGERKPSAVSVEGGRLVITADMENGSLISGGISHSEYLQYGKFVFSIRTDDDPSEAMSGVALTWPESNDNRLDGENNIYETLANAVGRNPFYSFIHEPNGGKSDQKRFVHNADGSQFQTMTMEWTPDSISITRSGPGGASYTETQTLNETSDNLIPDNPHRLSFQLDAWEHSISSPVTMEVDWVEVYKYCG